MKQIKIEIMDHSSQVLEYMGGVKFTIKTGEEIFFDARGDPVARYDLVNWQPAENEGLQFKHVGVYSPFHTEIPENTRVMCSGICSRIVRFTAFTLPVIFRNLCVHSHTTRKDPVKTRDLSCDVYNARSPFH